MFKNKNLEAHKDLNIKKDRCSTLGDCQYLEYQSYVFSIKQFQLLNRTHIIHFEPEQNLNS